MRAGTALIISLLTILMAAPATALDLYAGWLAPSKPFSPTESPEAPDYNDPDNWAALPDRKDNADLVPAGTGLEDRQANAVMDVFYIHPTSYLIGGAWNSSTSNWLARLITDYGVLPQQAAVYNGIAKVYAPRYRQMSQGAQVKPLSQHDLEKARSLAFSDVRRAFDHFLDHYNRGRPFLIASHSQGTTHAVPLLQYLYTQRSRDARRFVAGYLIGNTVEESRLKGLLPVCDSPTATGCYLSWNAVAEGGDGSHWLNKGQPVCVNPLSWRRDGVAINKNANLGSLPITGPYFLDAPDRHQTGARCEDGILWIEEPAARGYGLALFPGKGYHSYDYNLFWMNIRSNLEQRSQAYLSEAP
ncbi:hypothetical protein FHR99_001875 [Litorivivens lipolytica]|uniref:DUF3089 domain-containing protein n=1 Tax=Litorivivens lipolytica TaxID=1524264 RepID=A0A7W4W663_9GAMM|nr:DUF3089 domain-containing protein [Litorivivens lipolytica]MBB3047609.1 hypothetical protein [Litorivivens lipolytica]